METAKNTPEFAKNHLLDSLVKGLYKVIEETGTTEASQYLCQMYFELCQINQEEFIPENRKTDFCNPQSYLLTVKSLSSFMYFIDTFKSDIEDYYNELKSTQQ